jgi:hypothetical protein
MLLSSSTMVFGGAEELVGTWGENIWEALRGSKAQPNLNGLTLRGIRWRTSISWLIVFWLSIRMMVIQDASKI